MGGAAARRGSPEAGLGAPEGLEACLVGDVGDERTLSVFRAESMGAPEGLVPEGLCEGGLVLGSRPTFRVRMLVRIWLAARRWPKALS